MKVDQTKFGAEGDCVRACVATYFELPLTDVPDFPTSSAWEQWNAFDEFIAPLNRRYGTPPPATLYFASGPAGRGLHHMVLMINGELAHDPHPSRAGLTRIDYTFTLS